MLLTQDRETIQSGGLGDGNSFTIAASAKAFEVLSSNLYQNKILAVIREITCNAADAHTEAGLPLSDIEVHLPNWSEPYFMVRDYGSGLSSEDVLNLYTTYFRSTKDNSNALIGGFGLGSKSPFAVADQFTVTSWHGGLKTTYVCYKQDGLPRVNTTSSIPCGTETGLAVNVAAKSNDISHWANEACRFFSWWPTLPNFGDKAPAISTSFNSDDILVTSNRVVDGIPDWAIFKRSLGRPTVMMGLVTYALDVGSIKGLPADVFKLIGSSEMFLNMPVGSLAVSPSRETLSYDPTTTATLVKKATEIAREVFSNIRQQVADQPSLYEARRCVYNLEVHSIIGTLIKDLAEAGTLTWRGKRIERTTKIDCKTDFSAAPTVTVLEKKAHWKNFQRIQAFGDLESYVDTYYDRAYIWSANPASAKAYRKISHNYLDPAIPRAHWKIAFVTGIPFDEFKRVLADKGFPEPIDLDDLEDPPKAERNPTKTTTQGYNVRLAYDTLGRPHLEVEGSYTNKIDMAGGGIIVPCFHGSILSCTATEFYRRALRGGLISPATRYIGMTEGRIKAAPKLKKTFASLGWEIINNDFIIKHLSVQAVIDYCVKYKVGNHLAAKMGWDADAIQMAATKAHVQCLTYAPEAAKFIKLYNEVAPHVHFYNNNSDLYNTGVGTLYGDATREAINKEAMATTNELDAAWKALQDVRPMLRHVTWNERSIQDIIQYLKA